jgi:hypothetical protein
LNILVTTCDKNQWLLRGFAHLFNRYWMPDQPVTVLGYTPPEFELPPNFSFWSAGAQADYPFKRWSDALLKFLHERPDWDRVLILLEDYYIVRPVDVHAMHLLYRYMESHPNVLKIDTSNERLYSSGMKDFAYHDRLDLIKSDYSSQYHWSWWAGIWNRQQLLRVMIRGESCHDMELQGTNRLAAFKDDILILGTRNLPMRHITVSKHGVEGLNLDGLRDTDIRELRELGYLP